MALDRFFKSVTTPYGDVRVKVAIQNGKLMNYQPEYEDCKVQTTF